MAPDPTGEDSEVRATDMFVNTAPAAYYPGYRPGTIPVQPGNPTTPPLAVWRRPEALRGGTSGTAPQDTVPVAVWSSGCTQMAVILSEKTLTGTQVLATKQDYLAVSPTHQHARARGRLLMLST